MKIRVGLDPLHLTVAPMRERALAMAALVSVYLVIGCWAFMQGRLPWQDAPADLRSLFLDFRAAVVAVGASAFVLYQLWEAAFARSFSLDSSQVEVEAPLLGRRVVPRADIQHELTQTFVAGRRLFRVQVHLPDRRGRRMTTFTLAGGPDEVEPMLIALDVALRSPSPERFEALVPLADTVAAEQRSLERIIVALVLLGGVGLAWLLLR